MKKFFPYIIAWSLAISGCNKPSDNNTWNISNINDSIKTWESVNKIINETNIKIPEEDVKEMMKYIKKNWFKVDKNDYQFTFFDSKWNRHAMIVVSDNQISVWAYYEWKKDQEHFFGYVILNNEVIIEIPTLEHIKEKKDIEIALNEFIKKIKEKKEKKVK